MMNNNSYKKGILLLLLVFVSHFLHGQTTTIEYTETSAEIANPERGWYDDYYSYSGGSTMGTSYRPLDSLELIEQRKNDNITLILRLFYLHEFLEEDNVSVEYLVKMQEDFNAIRAAGVKCIIRFAYSASQSAEVRDATPSKVFSHIASLSDILTDNGDIIAGVQAGFIGAWGEWFYTENFAGPGYSPDSTDQANRRILVENLISILPEHITVQSRTPAIMKNIVQTDDPISDEEAFSGTLKSRIGHHNDCFLANISDYGTYTNLTEDIAYLSQTTKYTITGGETCDASNSYSDCVSSVPRMAELHWTYLNRDYNKAVFKKWEEQGCIEDVNISLGYRISLLTAAIPETVDQGTSLNLSFQFSSEGYAAPTQFKAIKIVLRHTITGDLTYLDYSGTNSDVRHWLPGTISSEGNVEIPAELADGNYSLSIQFHDKSPVLAENPAYSIQLANAGTWDEIKGLNSLNHIISVGLGGEGNLPAAPFDLHVSTVSETQIDLTWTDNSEDETSFEIMRSSGERVDWESIAIVDPNSESYSDKTLSKGTFYHYIIRSINEYGFSAWSDSATAPTMGVYVNSLWTESLIDLYPNPLIDSDLTIQFPNDMERHILISNITGARILETTTRATKYLIERVLFAPGIYFVSLNQNGKIVNKKLIIL